MIKTENARQPSQWVGDPYLLDGHFGGGCRYAHRLVTIEEMAAEWFARNRVSSPQYVNARGDSERDADDERGIYAELGELPTSTIISEDGLAGLLGKACRESIKRAVERGELPQPVKLMGKNCWTVGVIVKHMEDRLEVEARKVARMRPTA